MTTEALIHTSRNLEALEFTYYVADVLEKIAQNPDVEKTLQQHMSDPTSITARFFPEWTETSKSRFMMTFLFRQLLVICQRAECKKMSDLFNACRALQIEAKNHPSGEGPFYINPDTAFVRNMQRVLSMESRNRKVTTKQLEMIPFMCQELIVVIWRAIIAHIHCSPAD